MTLPLLCTLVAAVTTAVAWPWLCHHLPEPQPADGQPVTGRTPEQPKTLYRDLAAPATWAGAVVATGAAAWLGLSHLPAVQWPVWLVLSTLGAWQAMIDACTTWIPRRLAHVSWAALSVALVAAAAASPAAALWQAIGAAAAGGMFWLIWFASRGGFGFADVRFVPLVGAAAILALPGGAGWFTALVAGCLVTALAMAVERVLLHRTALAAWTPGLWLAGVALPLWR